MNNIKTGERGHVSIELWARQMKDIPVSVGSDAGSTLPLSILCHISSGVSVLTVGGVVAKVRNGKNTAKKKKAHSLGGDSKGRQPPRAAQQRGRARL